MGVSIYLYMRFGVGATIWIVDIIGLRTIVGCNTQMVPTLSPMGRKTTERTCDKGKVCQGGLVSHEQGTLGSMTSLFSYLLVL